MWVACVVGWGGGGVLGWDQGDKGYRVRKRDTCCYPFAASIPSLCVRCFTQEKRLQVRKSMNAEIVW